MTTQALISWAVCSDGNNWPLLTVIAGAVASLFLMAALATMSAYDRKCEEFLVLKRVAREQAEAMGAKHQIDALIAAGLQEVHTRRGRTDGDCGNEVARKT